jgi:glycine/D-amino acid oxidase-like deaminating enzyme
MHDFLIIGGGIFGLSTAVELAKRKYKVVLLNPDRIPHHLAASTDISKIVRMEYGTDTEYFKMVEICMERWLDWNDLFKEKVYHEIGFLMLCKQPMDSPKQVYEQASYEQLQKNGYPSQRMDAQTLKEQFPVFNNQVYVDANFNKKAGFVESALVIEQLADYARSLGVTIEEGQTAIHFDIQNNRLKAIKTLEGNTYKCGHAIVTAGSNTPYLLPELQPFMKATGHPVFWLRPQDPSLFKYPHLTVFTADIANSGWYGFPYSTKTGVVKVAQHTNGLPLHPDKDDRQVSDAEVATMRQFLRESIPSLANAPLVYTRRCLYTDTLDGHFWIDQHPEIKGLSVSSGGSGHAMKMGPILGEMTADMAEGKSHRFSKRYRWRQLSAATAQVEEARFVVGRKIWMDK